MQEILYKLKDLEILISEQREENDNYTIGEVHRNISEAVTMIENNGLKFRG